MHAAASRDLPCKSYKLQFYKFCTRKHSIHLIDLDRFCNHRPDATFTKRISVRHHPMFSVPPITANASFHSINELQLPPPPLRAQHNPFNSTQGCLRTHMNLFPSKQKLRNVMDVALILWRNTVPFLHIFDEKI